MLEVGVSLSPWILLEKVLGGFTGGTFPAGKNKKHRQEIMDLMMEQRHRQNKKINRLKY